MKYPTLVNALLWSCHPKRLTLTSTIEMISCFMDRSMYMKNLRHSTRHGSKRHNSQLKEVKAYKYVSEHQYVELTLLLSAHSIGQMFVSTDLSCILLPISYPR
ncbi:hypothetical protein R3W88_001418 [Solanum pinnatisectum]|uniref:Uncharacterized protein n=1 Tax=Solanum pinnatisectum TaxID=50273 RepID=A0AAV9MIG4_9SOLN|nr:hypothetical protein R3W88_001418 [Solanum pinnatisectum]